MRMVLATVGAAALATNATAQVWGGLGASATIEARITTDIQSADLNADGMDDVVAVVAAPLSPLQLGVYISSGPDAFAARVNLDTSSITNGIVRIALIDIDGDTDFDVVGINRSVAPFDLRVWLNDGAGAFSVGQTILDAPGKGRSVATGDFNGDDAADVAVRIENGVVIFLNDGFGMLGAPTTFAAGSDGFNTEIAVLDIDDDGLDDVVVADGGPDVIRILKSDGASLVEVQSVGAPNYPYDVAAGDMDGDGDIDIVSGSSFDGNAIRVYLNDGSGVFSVGFTAAIGDSTEDIEIVDLDGDADLDIVAARKSNSVGVRLFFNDGTGGAFSTEDSSAGGSVDEVCVGDVDSNGSPDLLCGNANLAAFRRILNQTDVLLPGAFDLISPANNSIGLPLPETLAQWPGGKPGTAPLKWTKATGFQNTYTVRIARDAAFTDVVLEQTDDASPFNVPDGVLEIGKRYYWTIDAENPIGIVSATSGSFTFATRAQADHNADGVVDGADLAILLSTWGAVE